MHELARRRAVLTQENALSFPFRVREVVEMGRSPWARTPDFERDEGAIISAVARADVGRLLDRRFTELSGGGLRAVRKQEGHMAWIWKVGVESSETFTLLQNHTSRIGGESRKTVALAHAPWSRCDAHARCSLRLPTTLAPSERKQGVGNSAPDSCTRQQKASRA